MTHNLADIKDTSEYINHKFVWFKNTKIKKTTRKNISVKAEKINIMTEKL